MIKIICKFCAENRAYWLPGEELNTCHILCCCQKHFKVFKDILLEKETDDLALSCDWAETQIVPATANTRVEISDRFPSSLHSKASVQSLWLRNINQTKYLLRTDTTFVLMFKYLLETTVLQSLKFSERFQRGDNIIGETKHSLYFHISTYTLFRFNTSTKSSMDSWLLKVLSATTSPPKSHI